MLVIEFEKLEMMFTVYVLFDVLFLVSLLYFDIVIILELFNEYVSVKIF